MNNSQDYNDLSDNTFKSLIYQKLWKQIWLRWWKENPAFKRECGYINKKYEITQEDIDKIIIWMTEYQKAKVFQILWAVSQSEKMYNGIIENSLGEEKCMGHFWLWSLYAQEDIEKSINQYTNSVHKISKNLYLVACMNLLIWYIQKWDKKQIIDEVYHIIFVFGIQLTNEQKENYLSQINLTELKLTDDGKKELISSIWDLFSKILGFEATKRYYQESLKYHIRSNNAQLY